jgi:hypothetical protein
MPIGSRLGLTAIAALTASPAINGDRRLPLVAIAAASTQRAAAGTSLIGCINWNSTIGLQATSRADANATRREKRDPSR